MDSTQEIAALKAEIERLRIIITELTEAMKILTDKDDRAKAFIERVEGLLSNAVEAKDDAVEARDEAVDALREEQK